MRLHTRRLYEENGEWKRFEIHHVDLQQSTAACILPDEIATRGACKFRTSKVLFHSGENRSVSGLLGVY